MLVCLAIPNGLATEVSDPNSSLPVTIQDTSVLRYVHVSIIVMTIYSVVMTGPPPSLYSRGRGLYICTHMHPINTSSIASHSTGGSYLEIEDDGIRAYSDYKLTLTMFNYVCSIFTFNFLCWSNGLGAQRYPNGLADANLSTPST